MHDREDSLHHCIFGDRHLQIAVTSAFRVRANLGLLTFDF